MAHNDGNGDTGHTGDDQDDGMLPERAALILVVAVLVGFIAGMLASWNGQSPAGAVLVGGGAAGATLGLAHVLIQRR